MEWEGSLSAFNTTTPFTDSFRQAVPGGEGTLYLCLCCICPYFIIIFPTFGFPANYTGVSNSPLSSPRSFVWRGYMSGPQCSLVDKCQAFCSSPPPSGKLTKTVPTGTHASYQDWVTACNQNKIP